VNIARCELKRKQGHRWAGYRAAKNSNRDADAVVKAEGSMARSDSASFEPVLRSRRPHARLETPRTRTGRPRDWLGASASEQIVRRVKAYAARPARPISRSRSLP